MGDPVDGRVLNGRYRLGALLGRGGMAEVYEAHDELLDRPVAVKLLRPDMGADLQVRSRFVVEARSAARLHHPNVVSVFDTGEDGGDPYLVMELLPGETLAERMSQGPVEPEWLCGVASDVLAALGAAHEAGLVHRDVKPGNVLIAVDGRAKVADFGIAKSMEAAGVDLTGTGLLLGTPAYLAPERIEGKAATPQSDLYSLGVVLYEALAGVKPFRGNTPMAVAGAIATAPVPPLDTVRPGLDPRLVAAVERAMAKDPGERPATAAEMAAELGLASPADTTVVLGSTATSDGGDLELPSGTAKFDAAEAVPIAAPPIVAHRRRLVLGVLAAAAVVLAVVLVASAGGGRDAGTGQDALARRLSELADRVEDGDGAKGPAAAQGLRKVAEQIRAGGGGNAATELMRDAAEWSNAGELSESAFSSMVALLRQVDGADATVLTTTTTPPVTTAPAPDKDDGEHEEREDEGRGKGKGRGKD